MTRENLMEKIENLPEGPRKDIARKLAETTMDFMGAGAGSKVADVAPDTKLTIPPDVANKNPVTVEDLMQIPWSHEWASGIYKMATGKEPSEEDIKRIIREKLLPEVRD